MKPDDSILWEELDKRVNRINPRLSWEIGPGDSKPWQFVISPNLIRDLRDAAREVIERAPVLGKWEFHSARQPKVWNFKFQMEPERTHKALNVDASKWKFVLLAHPDRAHEILLQGSGLAALSRYDRQQAAVIVFESVLGEDALLDNVEFYEIVDRFDDPRFAESARPVTDLKAAFLGRQQFPSEM